MKKYWIHYSVHLLLSATGAVAYGCKSPSFDCITLTAEETSENNFNPTSL